LLKVSKEFLGQFNVTLFNNLCLEHNLKMRTSCHLIRMMAISFQWSSLGWVSRWPIFSLISTSPMEGINVEEDIANNDDEGWDPWPVQQAQPPEPVANANNAGEQFSYQLSGLEDLPSDESVGFFNDIIIPQGVQFPQEEAPEPVDAVLALPAFPPEGMLLEGNNDQVEEDMQIEENINVGLMQHLEQSTPDPAFEDYMARKCFSSWADLVPDNADSVSVPKVWAAFFMGLLLKPDSFDWAKKNFVVRSYLCLRRAQHGYHLDQDSLQVPAPS
jgi:hypothetical protein